MALINCPECAGEVSDRAKSCPKCGRPLVPKRPPAGKSAEKETWSAYFGCCLAPMLVVAGLAWALVGLISGVQKFKDWQNTTPVTASAFGAAWPLTVPKGKIITRSHSKSEKLVIFEAPDGQTYGVNGTAQRYGYTDIHQITKYDHEDGHQRFKDVSPLIEFGLKKKR